MCAVSGGDGGCWAANGETGVVVVVVVRSERRTGSADRALLVRLWCCLRAEDEDGDCRAGGDSLAKNMGQSAGTVGILRSTITYSCIVWGLSRYFESGYFGSVVYVVLARERQETETDAGEEVNGLAAGTSERGAMGGGEGDRKSVV